MKKFLKDRTIQIMIGLVLGIVFGVVAKFIPDLSEVSSIAGIQIVDSYCVGDLIRLIQDFMWGLIEFLGNGFINLIKMTVVPLVFISLVCGMSTFGDAKKLGRVGGKVLGFYLMTTAIAVTMAIILALIIKPGIGLDMSQLVKGEYSIPDSQSTVSIFLGMIPTNPIQAMAEGNMLQVIIFAVIFGLALNLVGEKGDMVVKFFEQCNTVVMKVVDIVMIFAPIGVCALITKTMYSIGFGSIYSIAKYMFVVIFALIVHASIIYGSMFKLLTKLPMKPFLKAYSKVAGVAFSTSSSNATLPVSMDAMKDLGISKNIYSFSLPLGATVNMDGTAIMQGVAVIFISQVYNIDLSVGTLLSVILTAVLASVGTAGVPGVGMITLAMVLQSANLPLEGIALIIGFDRILDMMRTTVNVMGDCICSVIVAKSEKELDMDKYLQYAD